MSTLHNQIKSDQQINKMEIVSKCINFFFCSSHKGYTLKNYETGICYQIFKERIYLVTIQITFFKKEIKNREFDKRQ